MKTPLEVLLDSVTWALVDAPDQGYSEGLPYATHEGMFEIGGHKLRCYRLNTGQAILNAEDVHAFFVGALE